MAITKAEAQDAKHRLHGRPGTARPHQDTADIPADHRTIQEGQKHGAEAEEAVS